MPVHRLLAAAAAAAALASLAAPARADLVRLIDGRTVEGEVSRSGNSVKVKGYKGKSTTYPASEIKFVEEGPCSWDVMAKMLKEIPADASDMLYVEKHLEVARYLRERKQYNGAEFADLLVREYEGILKRDPENEEANLGLGRVKWGKWWFRNEKEKEKFRRDAPPAQMEPLGYVKYRKTGTWELKEDVEALDAGKVKFKGKWMTPDEKKQAEGWVRDEKGNWVLERDLKDAQRAAEVEKSLGEKPVTVTSSPNFRFISWLAVGETAQIKEMAEKGYAWVRETFGYPVGTPEEPGEKLFDDPIDVFILVDGKRKDKWLDVFGPGYGYDQGSIDFHKKGSGWHRLGPVPYFISSGAVAEKNRQRDTEGDFYNAGSHVASMVGRIVLDRIRPQQHIQPWLSEGTGLVTEIRFHETADCCYVTESKYREEVANKGGTKAKYYDFMKGQASAGLDRPLRQVFALELNQLDWADSVKSWCFLEFLVEKYLPELRTLLRQPMPEVEEILPIHVDAAIKGLKPKDPSAPPRGPKDEGPLPTAPIRVKGAGATQVTPNSKESRAVQAATAEAWLQNVLKKDADALEKEWKEWLLARP